MAVKSVEIENTTSLYDGMATSMEVVQCEKVTKERADQGLSVREEPGGQRCWSLRCFISRGNNIYRGHIGQRGEYCLCWRQGLGLVPQDD